jgi:hypothetical protein
MFPVDLIIPITIILLLETGGMTRYICYHIFIFLFVSPETML